MEAMVHRLLFHQLLVPRTANTASLHINHLLLHLHMVLQDPTRRLPILNLLSRSIKLSLLLDIKAILKATGDHLHPIFKVRLLLDTIGPLLHRCPYRPASHLATELLLLVHHHRQACIRLLTTHLISSRQRPTQVNILYHPV